MRPAEHFRLVVEGPKGGRPLRGDWDVPPAGTVPYKLWEVVPGAVLEVHAPPESAVEARVGVRTPLGRRFLYRARGRTGGDGVARLRVPYASDTELPVRPEGAWRVRVGGRSVQAIVRDADVREGTVIRVDIDR